MYEEAQFDDHAQKRLTELEIQIDTSRKGRGRGGVGACEINCDELQVCVILYIFCRRYACPGIPVACREFVDARGQFLNLDGCPGFTSSLDDLHSYLSMLFFLLLISNSHLVVAQGRRPVCHSVHPIRIFPERCGVGV